MAAGLPDTEETLFDVPETGSGDRSVRAGALHRAPGARRSSNPLLSHLLQPPAVAAMVGAVITVLTWYPALGLPTSGLDPSWRAGLAMALAHHLPFGHAITFTYGPLGAATSQVLLYGRTAALAFVYALVVHWLTATLLVVVLRRHGHGWLATLVLSWVATAFAVALVDGGDLALGIGLLLALSAIRSTSGRERLLTVGGLAVLAAVQSLVKVSGGGLLVLILVVVVLSSPRRLSHGAVGAGSFVTAFSVGWFGTGQQLRYLTAYLHQAISTTLGYGPAMSITLGNTQQDWYAIVLLVLLAAGAFVYLRNRSWSQRIGEALVLLLWSWVVLKEGFVRHDTHDLTYFGLFVVVFVAYPVAARFRVHQVTAVALSVSFALAAAGGLPPNVVSPVGRTGAFVNEVGDIASSARRSALITGDRAALSRSGYDSLPPSVLDRLAGHTVAIEPWENMIAWVHPQLRWDPEPVLQGYSAYTTYLDDLDARFLYSHRAPQLMLWQVATIDFRDPWFDPPLTEIATMCRYRQVTVSGIWQLLSRVPDRCGRPYRLSTTQATYGQSVPVPKAPPGSMVAMTVSLHPTLLAKIEGLAVKGPPFSVTVSGGGGTQKYRFITGTAADLHVMVPPSDLGYSAPFAPPAERAVRFAGGGWSAGQGKVTVTFYAVPVRP